ncbi:helix-turn-helix domain-containing protein [Desertihabitans aurantiacus]|uniref:helix-turn-helix domain-containing protein n=1 Tax=Desertihabitans aurantiacus TaxID=2282477 RepID=UPI000DF7A25C|nr:helix-turn-helix domain-containing protein [Desertihabitans aurantiacus]
MDYVGRTPAPPLDRLVDDVYVLTGTPRHRRLNVPPMPSAHLFVNLGGPARLWDPASPRPPDVVTDGWFMGLWTRRFEIEHHDPVRLVGVHFKPWGLAPFTGVAPSELRDRWVPADAVWGPAVGRMRDRLADAPSTSQVLDRLEEELRRRLDPEPPRGLALVHHTTRRLAGSGGTVPVGRLVADAGVSADHLVNQFRRHVGVTPKRVARIYRFAALILSVDARGPVDWPGLAHTAGFFDQAHLGREFKEFTGHTPTAYLRLRQRFPAVPDFPPDSGPMPADEISPSVTATDGDSIGGTSTPDEEDPWPR